MKIHLTMPRTGLGRLIAAVLTVAGVLLFLFFFTAILIIVAVAVVGFLVRSAIVGKKKRAAVRADEVSAKYEVLNEEARAEQGTGEHILPRHPPVDRGACKDKNE